MKKKIAIMLTLILAAGTFTACSAEEKVNNDIKTSVASKTADVSVSKETSATANTLPTAEKETTKTAEKATASKETEPSKQDTKSEEKADRGQNSAVIKATDPIQKTESKVQSNSRNTANRNQSKPESIIYVIGYRLDFL